MSKELTELVFFKLPVGIIKDIQNLLEMIDDGAVMKFRGPDNFGFRDTDPDESLDYVDTLCLFYIDDRITYQYKVFLGKYVDRLVAQMTQMEKIYATEVTSNDNS